MLVVLQIKHQRLTPADPLADVVAGSHPSIGCEAIIKTSNESRIFHTTAAAERLLTLRAWRLLAAAGKRRENKRELLPNSSGTSKWIAATSKEKNQIKLNNWKCTHYGKQICGGGHPRRVHRRRFTDNERKVWNIRSKEQLLGRETLSGEVDLCWWPLRGLTPCGWWDLEVCHSITDTTGLKQMELVEPIS